MERMERLFLVREEKVQQKEVEDAEEKLEEVSQHKALRR